MKVIIVRTIFTTGAVLVSLAIFFIIIGINDITMNSIIEIFGACVLINIGIHFRFRFEIRYFLLEFLIDVSYIILVLCTFWKIFNWIHVPIWYLVIMAAVIYLFVIVTTVYKIKKDTKEINELLQKRKEKM